MGKKRVREKQLWGKSGVPLNQIKQGYQLVCFKSTFDTFFLNIKMYYPINVAKSHIFLSRVD